jgi:FAD/FMN-containing dehydrogenase/Fe-S oxidoreductase
MDSKRKKNPAASLRPGLERRLKAAIDGDVLFDRFSRGRYATDASSYQMMPVGVVVPRSSEGAVAALALAREERVPVTFRGGGTSQCGQTVNEGLIIDTSKYLNRILSLDVAAHRCTVEPGIVLDDLNRQLAPHGLWFPVDVSTASRATIGGMAGNNSCGGRSLRYGTMRDNVIAIDGVLAEGTAAHFGGIDPWTSANNTPSRVQELTRDLLAIGRREAAEVAERFPKVQRRVGGYNLDALVPNREINLAHLLVGSEGTLALSTAIEIKLSPVIRHRALAVAHFGSFYEAMESAQHIVRLRPIAVELVDATMLALGRDIAMFRSLIDRVVKGEPQALLIVEFAEDDQEENLRRVAQLSELLGDLGFGFDRSRAKWGGVVAAADRATQTALADFRAAGLNVMMSMRDERKPVSFIEDCAIPLEHLADYTARLNDLFEKHGTKGTFYAHASEGCLHVRPVLNLKLDLDLKRMRAIAEEAFAIVRDYKGSHSGEHGDGIVRSEFHEMMFGPRLVRAFGEVKDLFDPDHALNPHRIVDPPKFDDRDLLRYGPDYNRAGFAPVLDWSAWRGGAAGFQGAVEMCNNNGACRNLSGGVMCPSYRVTLDERDLTRGRANTLRLAISGQLGPDAFTSDEMLETLKLCVSCKGCRRECPTGVDMAKMKIEVLAARAERFGISSRDRLVAYLPRYAPLASKLSWLMNLRNRSFILRHALERIGGMSARRDLPLWRRDTFAPVQDARGPTCGREVVLFADTFNRAFEYENLDDALKVLAAAGYRVHLPKPADGSRRPLCCGRTFLSAGLVDEARVELSRLVATYAPYARRGVPIIGLEPSCLLTLRDELRSLRIIVTDAKEKRATETGNIGRNRIAPVQNSAADVEAVAAQALLFEEFLAREAAAGRLALPLQPVAEKALVHGHCHQKAFDAFGPLVEVLKLVPGLQVDPIDSSCCGMAGAFGYGADTYDASIAMGELSLLPAVRKAEAGAIVVADGMSCRHQIADGTGREALHVARVLARSLAEPQALAPAG